VGQGAGRVNEATSPGTTALDPWQSCEPHLNSRLLEPLLKQYEREYGQAALEKLATELGTSLEVLSDPDRWFSAELFLDLIQRMVRDTGDHDITYKAGRALARPGMMGPERLLIRGLANPTLAISQMERLSSRLSKITSWDVVLHRRGRATATVHLKDDALDSIEFCRNRQASLEAIPEGFGLPPARVDHPTCVHRGDAQCVYEVFWVERNPWLQRGWIATGLIAAATLVCWFVAPELSRLLAAVTATSALVVGVASAFSYRQVEQDTIAMNAGTIDELQQLLERNDRRITELSAIQRVTSVATRQRDEGALIISALDELRSQLQYDRALMLRVYDDGDRLGRPLSSGFGPQAALLKTLDVSMHPDGDDQRLFGNILDSGGPLLVQVDATYLETLLPHNSKLLTALGSSSFVAAPVTAPASDADVGPLGLLVVDRTSAERPLTLRDRDLVSSVAGTLGTAISNTRHLRRVQEELLIIQKFRQYLPAKAAEEILADPGARLRLGGRNRELAILFTDIAGFTAASAAMSPEEVVRGLNAWFALTDPVIASCNGIVDKRMGDGMLIVFLPEDGDRFGRHPVERAAAAAVGMQASLEEQRAHIAEVAPGFAAIDVRYAIHYGSAIVGNMGSEDRMEYTVIGDAVNTCARLEEITPAGCIWLTGEAVAAVGGDGLAGATRESTITLRGRAAETQVWSLDPEADATQSGTWIAGLAGIEGELAGPMDSDASDTTTLTSQTGDLGLAPTE